jgi:ABC-type uncharacterized transport system permease subunit
MRGRGREAYDKRRLGLSEAVTTILLVVIGIAMALMIWQFFTQDPQRS